MSYFLNNYSAIRYPIENKSKGVNGLRNAQIGAVHAIASHFTLRDEPAIVVMPTGTGKTAVLMLTAFMLRSNRVLVVTPSKLVRHQIFNNFKKLSPLIEIGALWGVESPSVIEITGKLSTQEDWENLQEYDVVIGTPNSISPAYKNVAIAPTSFFDLLLIDEAHHSPAKTWNELLKAFPEAQKVLFTATPFRQDRKEIEGRFIYTYPLEKAYNDHIFGDIEYIPVPIPKKTNEDIQIALIAEKIYQTDKANGLNHFLMVRTDSKKRADELKDIYAQNTNLRLATIHSSHSYQYVMKSTDHLLAGELDGIICVNMFGEGFDFPNLKIAAIHAPHKSLAATLQFIGRFSRTNKDDIGTAKFISAPSGIKIATQELYDEDAIWKDIIINLSETRIQGEESLRIDLNSFDTPAINHIRDGELSLYSLIPKHHVKIYHVNTIVDITQDVTFPSNMEIIYKQVSRKLSTVVYITQSPTKPKWSHLQSFLSTKYDLLIIYYDSNAKLLFINSSTKNLTLYETLAAAYSSSSHSILPLYEINRVLTAIESPIFFNIGMRSRLSNSSTESYRIISGASADKSISKSDGYMYHRGHVFGKSGDNTNVTTLGYSSGSKVWSSASSHIPNFIEWCEDLANRIEEGSNDFLLQSRLKFLQVGEPATSIPNGIFTAEWNKDVYRRNPQVKYIVGEETRFASLLDLEININFRNINNYSIEFVICGNDLDLKMLFNLNSRPMYTSISKGVALEITHHSEFVDIVDYLNNQPLSFYSVDFSRLAGQELFRFSRDKVTPYPSEQIRPIDWKANNVDIQKEFYKENENTTSQKSIHDYLRSYLDEKTPDVIIYDHGTGEIADFIVLKEDSANIIISLYHVKGSGGNKPGDRVNDVYEVCGQTVKSLIWLNNNVRLLDKLNNRIRGNTGENSKFIKGDMSRMKDIFMQANLKQTIYQIIIVQPGISKSNITDKLGYILAAANDYVRTQNAEELIVWGSA